MKKLTSSSTNIISTRPNDMESESLSSSLKHGLIYWIGRMGSRTASFFLLPFYTARITPSEWGVLTLLMISADLITLAVGCQLTSALYRFWSFSHSDTQRMRLIGLVVNSLFFLSCILFLPLYFNADWLADNCGISGYGDCISILLATVQCALILSVIQAEIRLKNESLLYAGLDIGQNIFQAILSGSLVVFCGLGMRGILLGQLLSFIVAILLLLLRFLKRIELNFDIRLLKHLFKFSLPLVPSGLAMAMVNNIDRYILQAIAGSFIVGIYSIGYKFGSLVTILVVGPFMLFWEPQCYKLAKDPNSSGKIGTIFCYFLAFLSLCGLALSTLSKEIVQMMTSYEYWSASSLVPIIVASYIIFGMDTIIKIGLLVSQKTQIIFLNSLLSCVLNIIANMLLIPVLGMIGSALSTFIAFSLLFLLDLVQSTKYLPITWHWKRIRAIAMSCFILILVILLIPKMTLYSSVVLKSLVLCFYPLFLVLFGFFEKGELSLIYTSFRMRGARAIL